MKKKILFLLALFTLGLASCTETKPDEPADPGTTETPGTETPGTETPGTETPGTETPGTETPGTETPGTETPGTETPGTETPGTETPGDITTSDAIWDSVNSGDEIKILEASGHLESAYIEWTGVKESTGYNVYYKADGEDTYNKVDKELLRLYPTYLRCDILGLKAGSYTIKIVPVFNETEGSIEKLANVVVAAHDRSGYAFSNGYNLGAYNQDGTLKENAQVVYVTKDTAKTCQAYVNGATQTGLQTILDAKQKANTSNDILCIRFIGSISLADLDHISSSAQGLQIKGRSANTPMNITIEGVGEDACANGFGFLIRNCSSVEVRNLGIMNYLEDGISIDTGNSYLWVHNCDFFYGKGGSGDKAKGDGSLDIKGTEYATVSYNHFWDSGKCHLTSNGDHVDYITYHHNWYDHSDSRHPRVRISTAIHVYNNYFDGVSKYAAGATTGSSIYVEGNYFENTRFPFLISMQGSDIYDSSKNDYSGKGTFSSEPGGMIKAFDNYIEGAERIVYANSDTSYSVANSTHFDAYLATSRDEVVPSTYVCLNGTTPYSNFDTQADFYEYLYHTPQQAKDNVMKYAGRINGGDFKWEFDASEDTNYEVIPELKSAVTNYQSTLVKSLGIDSTDDNTTSGGDTGSTGGNTGGSTGNEGILASTVYNVTELGTSGGNGFSVSGNLKGDTYSVTYGDYTLTKAMKLESSTQITFTTTEAMTLTIVFEPSKAGKIKVDDTNYAVSTTANVVTIELEAGSHVISKGSSELLLMLIILS